MDFPTFLAEMRPPYTQTILKVSESEGGAPNLTCQEKPFHGVALLGAQKLQRNAEWLIQKNQKKLTLHTKDLESV